MAERINRDPAYDLTRHIATGEKPPLSGSETVRQYDAELDRNNPAEFSSLGERLVTPNDHETILAIHQNEANQPSVGQSGEGRLGQQTINMKTASDCLDEPEKGGIAYGPRYTGESYG